MLVLYESQRQNMSLFLLTQNQENLLLENERLADETHANELRHMIDNVAHDLKTPLSAFVSGMDFILSVMGDLKAVTKADTEIGRGLTSILDSIHNMKNVNEFMLMTINRCIDYTKASQGLKLVPRMETINFAEAINLPMRCMKDMQQDNKIQIKLMSIPAEIAANIITDKQWLQENILCLLSNAVRYSAGGVVSIAVSLSSEPSSQEPVLITPLLRIEIEDSGIGISEDMMCNLFRPFKQAQRLAGGTGLGLYSLMKRIEALNGQCGVRKRGDGLPGSVFWFAIPYRPDEVVVFSEVNSPTTSQKSPVVSDTQRKSETHQPLRILIVDDSLSILKMSSMMLRRQGHTIATAENGAIAVDMVTSAAITATPYDVVLMDLQMPVMDGLEATRRIREFEKERTSSPATVDLKSWTSDLTGATDKSYSLKLHRSDQLIIGVSANSDNETMEAAFAAGIDAFIPKPFTLQSFNETYLSLLAEHCEG
eukprot:gene34241-biopygen29168